MNKLYIWISVGIIVISVNLANNLKGIHSTRAIYVHDVIKNTNWPDRKKAGHFVIGVLGSTTVTNELKELTTNRKSGSKGIMVNNIATVEEIENCSVIYITSENTCNLEEITEYANKRGVLVVTEGEELSEKGAPFNFISKSGKFKFKIDQDAANLAKLSFSNKLLAREKTFN